MLEWQLGLICLKLTCLFRFLNTGLIGGFADFSSSAASVSLSSGTGVFLRLISSSLSFFKACACVYFAVATLLEYSEEYWEAIWSLLPALHNKNRHTSTPVMDDKEMGTLEQVGRDGRGWERLRVGIETTNRARWIKITLKTTLVIN